MNDLDYENIASQINIGVDDLKILVQNGVMAFESVGEKLRNLFDELTKIVKEILEINPKKRYKLIRKIEPNSILLFFNRKYVVHCRNNC